MTKTIFNRMVISLIVMLLITQIAPAITLTQQMTRITADSIKTEVSVSLSDEEMEVAQNISDIDLTDGILDTNKMTHSEVDVFKSVVSQVVNSTLLTANTNTMANVINDYMSYFNSKSEIFGDMSQLNSNVQGEVGTANIDLFNQIMGGSQVEAARISSVGTMGNILNIAIGIALGMGLSAAIYRYGFATVARLVGSRVLAMIRIRQVSTIASGLIKVVAKIANPGYYIARYFDRSSFDSHRNNGYIDIG